MWRAGERCRSPVAVARSRSAQSFPFEILVGKVRFLPHFGRSSTPKLISTAEKNCDLRKLKSKGIPTAREAAPELDYEPLIGSYPIEALCR